MTTYFWHQITFENGNVFISSDLFGTEEIFYHAKDTGLINVIFGSEHAEQF